MSLAALREAIGFKRVPLQCGPDDAAFMGFLFFANGDSHEAQIIRDIWQRGFHNPKATSQQNAASFIDWLIQRHWGEAEANHAAAITQAVAHG